jgi:hypothetical protein
MGGATRFVRVLGLLSVGALPAACAFPIAKLYEGPERPPDQLAYISLTSPFLGIPVSVTQIDGTALEPTIRPPTYAAVEPGVHEVVLRPPPGAVRQVGPAVFPYLPTVVEREYHAGRVYDWYRAEALDEADDAAYFWMAPSADPIDHGGLGFRWSAAENSLTTEGFRMNPSSEPTPVHPSAYEWQVDSAVRELRDRPRTGGE